MKLIGLALELPPLRLGFAVRPDKRPSICRRGNKNVFYGLRNFGCKTAQLCVTQREWLTTETPSISVTVQRNENTRKNSFLNYEFPALTAELQVPTLRNVRTSNNRARRPILLTSSGRRLRPTFGLLAGPSQALIQRRVDSTVVVF
jgi:hypothetical protein